MIFLIVVVLLAAGAGLSVVLRGKNLKPKSRSLMVSKPQHTLNKIVAQFSDEVDDQLERKFIEVYNKTVSETERKGAGESGRLEKIAGKLDEIREDGKITPEEARMWIKTASGDDAHSGKAQPPEMQ